MANYQDDDSNEVRLVSPYQNNQPLADSGTVARSFFAMVFEILKTIFIVGVLALIFRVFIIQPFIVEGHSMDPTLSDKDYLLIDKISYKFFQPQRGDIIVFRYPKDERLNYIKRVIGLPGERVRVTDREVTVFNSEDSISMVLNENYLLDPDGKKINTGQKVIEVEIPANSYFVMGDNRLGSSDSRIWGALDKSEIIGRFLFRLFPLNHLQLFHRPEY